MTCPICGSDYSFDCEDLDSDDTPSDLQNHMNGDCNPHQCRFCDEENEPEASVNYFMTLEMNEGES